MHRPPHHAPLAVSMPTSVVPRGRRAPTANDLTNQPAGAQPAALMSLVRALARQAVAELLQAHGGAEAPVQTTPIPHPPQEG
jgi:hypothetical protein